MRVNNRLMPGAGYLSLSLLLCCAGCSGLPPVQAPAAEIRVPDTRYVNVPAADTTPCPQPQPLPAAANNGDLAQHDAAEAARGDCDDKQLQEIARKQGQPVQPAASATASPPTPATTAPPQPLP